MGLDLHARAPVVLSTYLVDALATGGRLLETQGLDELCVI